MKRNRATPRIFASRSPRYIVVNGQVYTLSAHHCQLIEKEDFHFSLRYRSPRIAEKLLGLRDLTMTLLGIVDTVRIHAYRGDFPRINQGTICLNLPAAGGGTCAPLRIHAVRDTSSGEAFCSSLPRDTMPARRGRE